MGAEARPLVEPVGWDPGVAPHEVPAGRGHVGERCPQHVGADAPAPVVGGGGHASQPPRTGSVRHPRAGLGINHRRAHHLAVGRSGGERRGRRVVVDREAGRPGRSSGPQDLLAQGVGGGGVDLLDPDARFGREVLVGRAPVGHGIDGTVGAEDGASGSPPRGNDER